MMLTIVTGSIATTVFKQPFWWATLAIVTGSLVGAVFMALHSAQGPQLGVPQMIYGYNLPCQARLLGWVSGGVLAPAFVWIIFVHGLPSDTFTRGSVSLSGFLGSMLVAALWQIAYAPYVSDYLRYLPPDTAPRTAFWSSYFGCM